MTTKLLGFLNPKSPFNRILRRAIVIGVLAFIAVILNAWVGTAPAILVPIITAILAALDKTTREIKK